MPQHTRLARFMNKRPSGAPCACAILPHYMQILQDEGERGSAYMQYEKNVGALAMRGVKKGCALHD